MTAPALMEAPTHHRAVALVLAAACAVTWARAGSHAPAARADVPRAAPGRCPPECPPRDAVPPRATGHIHIHPIDPNTATVEQLVGLPGVGPALARRVLDARAEGARFGRPYDLRGVRGFGPRTVQRLAPYLVFPEADAGPDAAGGVRR